MISLFYLFIHFFSTVIICQPMSFMLTYHEVACTPCSLSCTISFWPQRVWLQEMSAGLDQEGEDGNGSESDGDDDDVRGDEAAPAPKLVRPEFKKTKQQRRKEAERRQKVCTCSCIVVCWPSSTVHSILMFQFAAQYPITCILLIISRNSFQTTTVRVGVNKNILSKRFGVYAIASGIELNL